MYLGYGMALLDAGCLRLDKIIFVDFFVGVLCCGLKLSLLGLMSKSMWRKKV